MPPTFPDEPTYITTPDYYTPSTCDRLENTFFGRGTILAVQPTDDDIKVTVKFDSRKFGTKDFSWSVAKVNTRVRDSDAVMQAPKLSQSVRGSGGRPAIRQISDADKLNALVEWGENLVNEKNNGVTVDGFKDMVAELKARHGKEFTDFRHRLEFLVQQSTSLPLNKLNDFFLNAVRLIEAHPDLCRFKSSVLALSNNLRPHVVR